MRLARHFLWILALVAGLSRPAAAEDVQVRIDVSESTTTWYVAHLYEPLATFADSFTFTGITSPVMFTLRIGPEFFTDFINVTAGQVVTTGDALVAPGFGVQTAAPIYFAGGTDLVVNVSGSVGNRGSSTPPLPYEIYRGRLIITPVPEAPAWLMAMAGAAGLGWLRRRRPGGRAAGRG